MGQVYSPENLRIKKAKRKSRRKTPWVNANQEPVGKAKALHYTPPHARRWSRNSKPRANSASKQAKGYQISLMSTRGKETEERPGWLAAEIIKIQTGYVQLLRHLDSGNNLTKEKNHALLIQGETVFAKSQKGETHGDDSEWRHLRSSSAWPLGSPYRPSNRGRTCSGHPVPGGCGSYTRASSG
jgi:hypothetical protein